MAMVWYSALPAGAAVNYWQQTANPPPNSIWDNIDNWLAGIPTATSDAIFPTPIPATGGAITLVNGDLANSLTFRDAYTLSGGNLTLTSGLITVAPSSTATINSALIGTGGITLAANNGLADPDSQIGGGTLVLGGTNTYSGLTTINSGILSISSATNLGDASATNSLVLAGGTLRSTGATVDLGTTRSILLGTGGGILSTGTGNTLTVSGALSGTTALGVTGGGTVILGADNSGYSGDVTVDSIGGTTNSLLRLTNNNAITGGTVTLKQGTIAGGTGTQLDLANVTIGSGATLVMNSNVGGNFRSQLGVSTGNSIWNGAVTLNGDGLDQLSPASGASLTMNGAITGSAGFTGTLFIRGAGTGTINGAVNIPNGTLNKTDGGTWTINSGVTAAAVQVSDGTMKLGASNILPSGIALTVGQASGTSGTFDLNGFDQSFAGVQVATGSTGTERIVNSAAGLSTLTLNTAGNGTFTGVFGNTNANNLKLVLNLTGTETFTSSSSYTGGTALNSGTLKIANVGALGTGDTTVASGAVLDTSPLAGGNVSGNIILNGATLQHSVPNQLAFATGKGVNVLADSTINVARPGPIGKVLLAGGQLLSSGGVTLTKTGGGDLQLSGANPGFAGSLNLNGGFLEVQNSGALGSSPGVTINNGGELLLTGGGVATSAPANVFNTPLTLNTGATISSNGIGQTDFQGPINVAGNSTIALRYFQTRTSPAQTKISGTISGTGNLTVAGTPMITIGGGGFNPTVSSVLVSGNNSGYSGNITISHDAQLHAVQGSSNDALGSGAINLNGGMLSITPQITSAGGTAGFLAKWALSPSLISNGIIGGFDFGFNNTGSGLTSQNLSITASAITTPGTINTGDMTVAGNRPAAINSSNNFGIVYSGILKINTAGPYVFSPGSDDGTIVTVDGMVVGPNDFSQGVTTRSGAISLNAGLHSVVVRYGEGGGGTSATVNYVGADTGNAAVLLGSVAGTITTPSTISNILGTATIDNNISTAAGKVSTIDLAAANVTSTGTLSLGTGSTLQITGQTGSETFTQQGDVTINGVGRIATHLTDIDGSNVGVQNQSAGADMVITGNINEATPGSTFIKTGARTLQVNGTFNNTGGIVLRGGTLLLANPAGGAIPDTSNITLGDGSGAEDVAITLGANNQLPSSLVLKFNNRDRNAKLNLNGFTQTITGFDAVGRLAIIQNLEANGSGTGTLIVNNATDTTFAGLIRDQSGTLALTKQGAGTLTLSGNGMLQTNLAVYTGTTTVSQGKLLLLDQSAFNSPVVLNGGSLEFQQNFGRNNTYGKGVTDNGLGFTKSGQGALVLSGNSTVTGTVNVAGGAMVIQGAIGNNTVLPGASINVSAGGQLDLYGAAGVSTYNNNVTLNGITPGGAIAGAVSGGTIDNTLSGTITLAKTSNVSTGWADKTFRMTGPITGPGGLQFDKMFYTQQPPVFQVNNAANDYAGGTTINAGTVYFTAGLPAAGNLKFGGYFTQSSLGTLSGPNLALGTNGITGGFTRAIGTGDGQVSFAGEGGGFSAIGGTQTVNFGGANGQVDWGGAGFSANAALWFNGSNSLGGASAFNADSEVNVTNDILLSNGGMRRVFVVDNNGSTTDQARFSGVISGTGGLIKDGGNSAGGAAVGGRLILSGANANTYSGVTDVIGGVLALSKTAGVNAVSGDLFIGGVQNNGTRRIVYLGANEQISDTANVALIGSNANNGDLRLFGFSETIGSLSDRSGGGIVEIAENGDTGFLNVPIGATAASTLTVGGNNTDAFYNGFFRNNGGGTTGSLSLTKIGTGTQTISAGQQSGQGNASYNGPTLINAGTLQYANLTTFNSVPTIAPGANLAFLENIAQTATFGQIIGGGGNVIKNGLGTVILNQVNTYGGTTTVNGGTLQITNTQSANATGGYIVNNGGTLLIGNGTNAGVLSNNNNITVNAGGIVAFTRNNAYGYTGIISGAGNVEGRTGGGVITLSGANTYTGSTTVTGGTVVLAGSGISGGGLNVRTGGTLTLDFGQANSSATDLVAPTAPVTLGINTFVNAAPGGTLNINGAAAGTNAQTLGNVSINRGVNNINLNVGAGGTLAANFGTFTGSTGGILNLGLPAGATATTTSTGIGGILGGYAITGGNSYIAVDGTGNLTALAVGTADTYGPGVNTDVVAGGAGASTNSIRFNTAAANTVTFTGNNSIDSGGILVTSNVGNNSSTLTGGTITAGANNGIYIVQNNTANTLNISSAIGDGTGPTNVTKAGGGTLILSGTNAYSGNTIVAQGTLVTLGTTGGGNAQALGGATLQIGDGANNGILPNFGPNAGTVVISNGSDQTLSTPFNANNNFNFIANALSNGSSFQTGTFQKTGPGTLTITNALIAANFHPRAGTTIIDSGGNVQSNGFASIGLANGENATLTIKGVGKYLVNADMNVSDQNSSRGTMNVQDQAIVSAANLFVGKTGTSVGVVNQTFGTVNNVGGSNDWRIGGNGTNSADTGAYGVYNLSAGSFQTARNFQIGASGIGVFNQTGGTVNVTGGFNVVGRYVGGNGLLNISNGTYTNTTTNHMIIGEGGSGVVNVSGAGQLLFTAAGGAISLGSNNGGPGAGVLNLLSGGLVVAPQILDEKNGPADGSSIVNFNGGTLRVTTGSTLAGTYMGGLTNSVIYNGGAFIDTNGVNTTIAQPLLAPTGNSISGIAVGTGGSGYVGEPIVKITGGGGTGATARAIVSGGAITGFVITSPGSGYTSDPIITILGGGPTVAATPGAVTSAPADSSGGLTKLNTGTLTLTGTGISTLATTGAVQQTYGGATSVNGGTLTLDFTGFTSANTANVINNPNGFLNLGGGTLNLFGHANATAISTLVASTTSGSNSVTLTTGATTSLVVGQAVSGLNIPANSIVSSITSGTVFTINQAATATATGTALTASGGNFTSSQTFAFTTINPGASAITATPGGGTTLNLGILSRAGGSVDIPSNITVTTVTPNNFGSTIIGGYATYGGGANWASSAAPGDFVTPGNITALSSYINDTWAAGNNTTVTASTSQAGITDSLRFNNNGAFTVTLSGTTTINTGGILITPSALASNNTITGGTLQPASDVDLVINHYNTGTFTIASILGPNGNGAVVKAGPGTTIFSAANTYLGNTVVGAGTLRLGNAAAIPSGAGKGDVLVNAGATLDLNQQSPTINSLSGYGTVTIQTAPSASTTYTLTEGASGTSSTFNGVINNNGNAVIALTKTGAGTLTLANLAAGSFTGATTISGGAIDIATPLALSNNTTVNVNVTNGLKFDTTVPVISALAGNSGFALQTQAGVPVQLTIGNNNAGATYSGGLTGPGTLIKSGTGSETFTGANLNTGGLVVNAGTMILQGNDSGASGLLVVNNGGLLQLNNSNSLYGSSGRNLLVANGGIVTPQAYTANTGSTGFGTKAAPQIQTLLDRMDPGSTGVLALQADASMQRAFSENLDFSSSGQVSLGSTLTTTSGLGNSPVQVTGVITPNGNTYRLGGGGGRLALPNSASLAGNNNLVTYGGGNVNGLLFLNGSYSFTGSTTLNGATINNVQTGTTIITSLADGGSPSSIGAGSADASNLVLNQGVLQYVGNGSSTNRLFTLSNTPTLLDSSGSGPVNFTNTGPIAFLNSGARTLTLQGNNTGANTIAAAIGDAVNVAGTSGNLGSGATAITKNGNGTWILSGNNSFSGGVTINNGVLQIVSPASLGTSTVNGAASILVNGSGAVALGSAFNGSLQSTLNRISPLSSGTVALMADTNENLNLDGGSAGAGLPGVFLGATGNVTYTGNLTPFGQQYRLGGGGGTLTLPNGGLTGPRQLTIGGGGAGASFVNNANLNGSVVLGGTSDYTGGTVLSSGAILSATNLAALGSGPLKFQGGFYRAVDNTDITLSSDGVTPRDIRIGPDSTAAVTAANTANIDVVGGVTTTFSQTLGQMPFYGSNQTQASLTKWGAGTLILANGLTLGSSGGTASSNSGTLIVERGTLSILANPTNYNGNIQIGSNNGGVGTLKLGANNVFANTPAQFTSGSIIDVYNGSTLDLNGFSDTIRQVRGMGAIVNTGAGSPTLTTGTVATENIVFAGNLSGNFTLKRAGNIGVQFGAGAAGVNNSGIELWNNYNPNFTGKFVADGGGIRFRADGTLGSTSEPLVADKVTLDNGGVLYSAGGVPLVLGANRGITLGSGGGMIWAFNSNPLVVNGPITGPGMLTIADDSGTVLLGSDNNNYAGGTQINSNGGSRGMLVIGTGGTTGSLPAGNVTFASPVSLPNGRLYFFKSSDMTVPNNISGPGLIIQLGAGTTTLTGNNTTNQTTIVEGGKLRVDFTGGNTPIGTDTQLTIAGGDFEYVGPAGDNTLRLATLNNNFGGNFSQFANGNTGDTNIISTYGGSGNQKLLFGGNARTGTAGTVNFITNGGSNGTTNSISFASGPGANNAMGAAYYFNGADFAAYDLGDFVRAANFGSDANTSLNALTSGRFAKLTAPITNAAAVSMAGIEFSGSNNNLTMAASAALTMNGNPGGLLKSGGGQSIIGGGTGATLSNNSQELIVRTDSATDTLRIDIPITGTAALTKSGAGTLVLSAANTYVGTTFIDNGTILLTGNGVIGSAANSSNIIRIANSASSTATLTIDSPSASIIAGNNTQGDTLRVGESGNGTVNQSAGTVNASQFLTLGENMGSTGTYNISGGTLNVKNVDAVTQALLVGRAGTGTLNISGNAVVNVKNGAQVQLAAGVFNSATTYQATVANNGLSTGVGTITQTGGTLQVDVKNGGYQSNVYGAVILGVDGAGTYNLNGGTLISPVIARGHGTANFNLGGGTIKVPVFDPNNARSLPLSILNIDLPMNLTGTGAGKGTIDTNGSDMTVTGALSGTGGIAKNGAGTLTIIGSGSYAGGTDINTGTVVSSGNSLGTGTVNVGANGTLQLQGLQQGLLAKFYALNHTDINPAVTSGSANVATEFTSLDNFKSYLAGGPLVAVESTAARGKVSVNYLENGGGNQISAIPPALRQLTDGQLPFIADMSGKFNAPVAGDYTFQTRSDDATVVFIDGQAVVDNNRAQGQTNRAGTINLTAGLHDITVGYNEGGGGSGFSIGVTVAGQGQSFLIGNELNMSNALLSYGSDTLTIGSLAGAGTTNLGAGTLITGGDNSDTTYAGVITGTGNLTKQGTGTMTLTGANTYTGTTTISAGTLQVGNGGTTGNLGTGPVTNNASLVYNRSDDIIVSNAISGTGSLTQAGAGALLINSNQSYTGATVVNAGTLDVTGGSIASSSGVTVNTGGTYNVGSSQTIKSLTVNDGGLTRLAAGSPLKILTVGTGATPTPVATNGTGKIDLNTHAMVVDYSAGDDAAAAASVRSQIIKGYNASAPGAGDGDWKGTGITSSDAALTSGHAVGYALSSEVLNISGNQTGDFMGQTVDASSVLVRTTLNGDSNLDGLVGFPDLVAVAQHYGQNDGQATWFGGDFTFDGNVGFADLVAVAQNYGGTFPTAAAIPGAPVNFNADMAAAFGSVPEPSTLGVVALAGLALLRRRRK